MERIKSEVTQSQEIISEATEAQLRQLSDLQLSFVGGGISDTVPG